MTALFQSPLRRLVLASALGAPLLGCTGKLVSEPVDLPTASNPGSSTEYALLRQDFWIQAQWTLTHCKADEITTDLEAVVRPVRHADETRTFRIDLDQLATGLKGVEFEVEFYDTADLGGRVIKSINASAKDATADVLDASLRLAGTVAGFAGVPGLAAAVAPSQAPCAWPEFDRKLMDKIALEDEIAAAEQARQVIDQQLDHLTSHAWGSGQSPADLQAEIARLMKQEQAIANQLRQKKGNLAAVLRDLRISMTARFEPDWQNGQFPVRQGLSVFEKANDEWFEGRLPESQRRRLEAELYLRFVGVPPVEESIPSATIDGVILRQPKDADLFLCAATCDARELDAVVLSADSAGTPASDRLELNGKLAYGGRFAIPQAGRPVVLALHNGPFQENGVELTRDAQGRIVKYAYKTNASLAAGSSALADNAATLGELVTTYQNRDLTRKQRELEELTVEEGLLMKRKSIDGLKDELGLE